MMVRHVLTLIVGLVALGLTSARGDIVLPSPEQRLKDRGYPCETIEGIHAALESPDYSVRRLAVDLLVKRQGQAAIGKLGQLLNDVHIQVRATAASLLGKLSNDTGLLPMRRDLQQLMPSRIAHYDQSLLERIGDANVADAMDVARVLAELGDPRGYKLAGLTALKGRLEAQRYRAVHVLVEIADLDQDLLTSQALDPLRILEVMAADEESNVVLHQILTAIGGRELDVISTGRIVQAVIGSEHASARVRGMAQRLAVRLADTDNEGRRP